MADELKVAKSEPLPEAQLGVKQSEPLPGASQITGIGRNTGRRSDDTLGRAMDTGIDTAGGVIAGAGHGLAKTIGGITHGLGSLLHADPLLGEDVVPQAGLDAEKQKLQAMTEDKTTPEKVGGAIEEGAEWMAGDAALKTLGKLPLIAKHAPDIIKLIHNYPKASQIILDTLKGAAIGGTQAGVKATAEGKEPAAAAVAGAEGGATGGALGGVVDAATGPESKVARSLVNRSLGATARDVTYGNPAKALLDEGINSPLTGDLEAYKSALRAGKTEAEAAQAAGGRIAGVSAKIEELEPQLNNALNTSKARISVKDAILDPVYAATKEILDNSAMTKAEKDVAIDKLLDLQREMISGLGKDIDPKRAVKIKRDIGERINWGGTTAVTDEVKPVYKKLYGSLKNQIHEKVPEAAELDERLTNLFPAKKDLMGQAAKGEVAEGSGLGAGGWLGILEKGIGKIVPAVHALAKSPASKAALGVAGEETGKSTLPTRADGHVRFKASDGSIHDVPAVELVTARKIDPQLEILEQ